MKVYVVVCHTYNDSSYVVGVYSEQDKIPSQYKQSGMIANETDDASGLTIYVFYNIEEHVVI